MASRILAARDAVKDLLVLGLELAEPDRIQAAYVPVLERAGFTGWRIWVYGESYRDRDRLTRGKVRKELKVTVEVEVKYELAASPEEAGRVPPEWVDEQIEWVETAVFDLLNEAGVHGTALVASRFRNELCEVSLVLDAGRLHEDKVFASLIEVTYSEPAAG